jgi:hypothetical protein
VKSLILKGSLSYNSSTLIRILTIQPLHVIKEGNILKLGKRLKQIESMVTSDYTHICDCCCDNGLLGAALVSRHAAPHIHFVDVVPELMRELGKNCNLLLKLIFKLANSSPTKTDDKPVKVSSVGELIWQTNTD